LSGHKTWAVVILGTIAFTTLGGAMFFGILDAGHKLFSRAHGVCRVSSFRRQMFTLANADYLPVLIMWIVNDMVIDTAIAGLLWYYLHKVRYPLPDP
jgi:hypothetical protein